MKTTYITEAAMLSGPAAAFAEDDGIRGQWSVPITGVGRFRF